MRLKKQEQMHIEAHQVAFDAALARASFSVRQNAKLIGLDKIREPLAFCAALKATGYEVNGFAVPPNAGALELVEMQEIVDVAFVAALAAARAAP